MRTRVTLLMGLAFAFSTVCAADSPVEPVYRLDFDVEVKINAPATGQDSCPKTETSLVPTGYVDLCGPDPAERVCGEITDQDLNHEQAARSTYFGKQLNLSSEFMEKAIREVPQDIVRAKEAIDKKYKGRFPPLMGMGMGAKPSQDSKFGEMGGGAPSEPFSKAQQEALAAYIQEPAVLRYGDAVQKIMETKYNPKLQERMDDSKVREVIAKHVVTFEKALRKSTILKSDDVDTVMQRVRACAQNLRLAEGASLFDPTLNGSVAAEWKKSVLGPFFESKFEGPFSKTRKINVVADDPQSCIVRLNPVVWQHCVEDDTLCAYVVFHELAHINDSCKMLALAINADRQSRLQFTDEQHQKLFQKQKEAAQLLGNALSESVSCLNELSSPKKAVLDACGPAPKFFEKCPTYWDEQSNRSTFQQSQWVEAEADLWGATSLSIFLSERFKNVADRKKALFEEQKMWCASLVRETGRQLWLKEVQKTHSQDDAMKIVFGTALGQQPSIPVEFRKKAVQAFLEGDHGPIRANFDEQKDCHNRPDPVLWKKAAKNGWVDVSFDTHQPWGIRFNRNYLRNSDLRKALGCSLSKDVPFSCSPLGYGNSVLAQ